MILVAEVGPDIIHHGGDLGIAHHRADRGHRPLPPDDDVDRIIPDREIAVLRERGIRARAHRAFTIRHVAPLAGAREQFLAGRFRKSEAHAQ